MRSNPGGQIGPDDVIGRDAFIKNLWETLSQRSAVLTSERRFGKTTVMKKMKHEAKSGYAVFYRDLEAVKTPLEFAQLVLNDCWKLLSQSERSKARLKSVVDALQGAEIGGVFTFPAVAAKDWKRLLREALEDLDVQREETVVFFWDEIPFMLREIAAKEGDTVASEILDLLRAIRHSTTGLRMVFTGSIGLHHVLGNLKKSGYANSPINDMDRIEIGGLETPDAEHLAIALMLGANVKSPDLEETAKAIAAQTDNIPYFIHYTVNHIEKHPLKADPLSIEGIITDYLTHPQDPWDLRHYVDRTKTYYSDTERPVVLAILDAAATSNEPLSFVQMLNAVKTKMALTDDELVRDVLRLVQQDHYLVQDSDGAYRFKYTIIKRSWRLQRGFGA